MTIDTGADERFSQLPNSEIFDRISVNPWDEKLQQTIETQARTSFPRANVFFDRVPTNAYVEMLNKMKQAATLEEKYRLLAEHAPLDTRWARLYKGKYFAGPNDDLTWYDVIQGQPYEISPPQLPNGEYLPSSNTALEDEIKKFRWHKGIDLGSGTGNITRIMARSCGKVTAVDKFDFLQQIAQDKDTAQAENEERSRLVLGKKPHDYRNIEYVTADIETGVPADDSNADLVVSNGLTAFIPTPGLVTFAREIARVLEPGGSYFEAGISKPLTDVVKAEYCETPRGLLAYMIGELVTSPGPGESGAYPHTGKEISVAFREAGFSVIHYFGRGGTIVSEYIKSPPENFLEFGRAYTEQDYEKAQKQAISTLTTSENPFRDLHIYGKMARKYIFHDAYIDVLVSPLVNYLSDTKLDGVNLAQARNVLTDILHNVRSTDVITKEDLGTLRGLQEQLTLSKHLAKEAYFLLAIITEKSNR